MRFDPKARMTLRLLGVSPVVIAGIVLLIACGTPNPPVLEGGGLAAQPAYRLGDGDQIRVIVFSEPDLSGEFEVNDTGAVSLPLIGPVQAGGKTLREFEESIKEQLRQGYLNDPRVSVQVLNYRPFYIIGQVNAPGEYPYVNGMNVLNAVALAGGYTPRGNTFKVRITRDGQESTHPASAGTILEPGDVIRVPERFF